MFPLRAATSSTAAPTDFRLTHLVWSLMEAWLTLWNRNAINSWAMLTPCGRRQTKLAQKTAYEVGTPGPNSQFPRNYAPL
jgi:hypothetical protein